MSNSDEQTDIAAWPMLPPVPVEVSEVNSEYWGPRIEGETITSEFVQDMVEWFKSGKNVHEKYVHQILLQTEKLLVQSPTLVDIVIADGKQITVCGDIHGQFHDLLNIFEINEFPSEENVYLFNGDFVDRGKYSLEVILTLFGFKCLYPNSMYLARGNHESRRMNEFYGFETEVRAKLNSSFVDLFGHVFCCLPLAHVINSKILVLHGGLFSKDGVKLSDIRDIDRFQEPPEDGLMSELLWSDPRPGKGRGPNQRGVGIRFGSDVTGKFLKDNGLNLIVRSHEVKQEGYEIDHNEKLITVFSAPNYCNQFGNYGAFLRFQAPMMTFNVVQFSAVDPPAPDPNDDYMRGELMHLDNFGDVVVRNRFQAIEF